MLENRWSDGVAGEHVGQPRLDAHAEQGQLARLLPLRPPCANCSSPSLTPHLGVGLVGVPLRQAHRHVEVAGPGGEGAPEDRHDEPRVDGVEDVRRTRARGPARPPPPRRRRRPARRRSRDSPGAPGGRRGHRRLGAGQVVVGHDERLEEVALDGDARGSVTDATGADHEDAHGVSGCFLSSVARGPGPADHERRRAARNMTVPMTLTCTGTPRWAAPQTYMGKVIELGEALKLVMM